MTVACSVATAQPRGLKNELDPDAAGTERLECDQQRE